MSKKKKSDVEKRVDQVVESLVNTLEQSKNFVLEQAPDVARQMIAEREVELKFDIISFASGFIACLATVLICFFWNNQSDSVVIARWVIGIIAGFSVLPTGSCLFSTLSKMAQLKVAPKVFLLYRLKRLL
jgi:hypothetical protein